MNSPSQVLAFTVHLLKDSQSLSETDVCVCCRTKTKGNLDLPHSSSPLASFREEPNQHAQYFMISVLSSVGGLSMV